MSTPLEWFASSYSGSGGGQCLEVAYTWRKSSSSAAEGGACVEVATCPHTIHVRDSKNPDPETGPTFTTTHQAWSAFTAYTAR
ncbi:DUF397 domain-containing protein [Streptomyces sp. NPDC047042]|uniref:DUF397 domain-containing protein n=1 Tax=Streptomyces sp. NPDC047042 TaxID=3154807 RepID=UPI0033E1FEE9